MQLKAPDREKSGVLYREISYTGGGVEAIYLFSRFLFKARQE